MKKFIYKLNLKKTWPYILGEIILFTIIIIFLSSLDYAYLHYDEIRDVVETLEFNMFGISFNSWHVCLFLIFSIALHLIYDLFKTLLSLFYDLIVKNSRKE